MEHARSQYDFDVAILGGGSAGYAAARTAAEAGLQTVVIEGGKEVGGLCILRGCMPTKALLYAAEVLHLAQHTQPWGIHVQEVGFDFARVMARKNALIKEFADYRGEQLASGKFKFIRSEARFTDPHTLSLENGRTLSASHFLISTGSLIAPPPLPELKEAGYLDSDSALRLNRLPKSLIVLGGGAVGVEFGQFFARVGVKVTLVQRSHHILHELDTDAAVELEKVFRREGMEVFASTKLTGAWQAGGMKGVSFHCQDQTVRVTAKEILYALGRIPNTGSLALDKAGVSTERGRVVTNARMQTSAAHIYAAGDCTGPHDIVHLAVQQ